MAGCRVSRWAWRFVTMNDGVFLKPRVRFILFVIFGDEHPRHVLIIHSIILSVYIVRWQVCINVSDADLSARSILATSDAAFVFAFAFAICNTIASIYLYGKIV